MEAVGFAAASVPIVIIALQTTKLIYKTVGRIKGGPAEVHKLVTATAALYRLMDHLKALDEQANEILGDVGAGVLEDFRPLIVKCVADLESIRKRLDKLSNAPDHGRRDRAWTTVKTYLKAEDLKKMSTTIHFHVEIIGAQFGHAGM